MSDNPRKTRNRSVTISESEVKNYSKQFLKVDSNISVNDVLNKIINQDIFSTLDFLPRKFVDVVFLDPPYNMSKTFNGYKFNKKRIDEYTDWLENVVVKILPLMKTTASIYICGDWFSSTSIHTVLEKYFIVRNRITWEREKGRGAKTNWKNASEDIWYATMSGNYTFNLEDVKLKKKIIAPYKENGKPKDWKEDENGQFRLTHPSNLWNDITIPFWSMPENTEHPTQKPEKLLAKIILASSNKGDVIFDPFLGSGTTAVVAKKLERQYLGIELDKKFAAIALKRLKLAEENKTIQGYHDKVFWERNSLNFRK